jgi:hypothetical protein
MQNAACEGKIVKPQPDAMYEDGYGAGIYDNDDSQELEPASDTPLGDVLESILTQDGVLREAECGGSVSGSGSTSHGDAGGAPIPKDFVVVPIDPPHTHEPWNPPTKTRICHFHHERVGARIFADREIAGTVLCNACFAGKTILESERIGETDDDERHADRRFRFHCDVVIPRSGERERANQARYWERNKAAIMARRRTRRIALGLKVRGPRQRNHAGENEHTGLVQHAEISGEGRGYAKITEFTR